MVIPVYKDIRFYFFVVNMQPPDHLGINRYFTKPYDLASLYSAVDEIVPEPKDGQNG